MSSLISVLALCVLILSNGCFTLPVSDNVTTEKTMNLRLVADDDTTILPNIESLRSIEEHMGFDVTTAPVDLSGNKFIKALRAFDENSTPLPVIVTREELSPNKREFDDLPFTTVEPVAEADDADRRSIENESENGTQIMQVETTTTINTTLPLTSTTVVPEVTTSEPFTSTSTTSSSTSTTVVPEISTSTPFTSTSSSTTSSSTSTTVVPEISTSTPTTVVPEVTTSEPFTSTSTTVVSEVTTSEPFTSTSSTSSSTSKPVVPKVIPSKPFTSKSSTLNSTSKKVVPKVIASKPFTSKSSTSTSTLKPITSTSTEKYIGHLEDESKFDEEYEPTTKPTKIQRKSGVLSTTKKSKIHVEDKPEEKEESTVPTAVFDQQALDKVSNVPTDFLVLDESNDLIVTGLPNQTFTTTHAYQKEEEAKPLSQGEESSYSQEKESDH